MKDPLNGIKKVELLTMFEKIFYWEYARLLKHPKAERAAPYQKGSAVLAKVALVRTANKMAGFLPTAVRILSDAQLVNLDKDEEDPLA
jgi:hypothetical protein